MPSLSMRILCLEQIITRNNTADTMDSLKKPKCFAIQLTRERYPTDVMLIGGGATVRRHFLYEEELRSG